MPPILKTCRTDRWLVSGVILTTRRALEQLLGEPQFSDKSRGRADLWFYRRHIALGAHCSRFASGRLAASGLTFNSRRLGFGRFSASTDSRVVGALPPSTAVGRPRGETGGEMIAGKYAFQSALPASKVGDIFHNFHDDQTLQTALAWVASFE